MYHRTAGTSATASHPSSRGPGTSLIAVDKARDSHPVDRFPEDTSALAGFELGAVEALRAKCPSLLAFTGPPRGPHPLGSLEDSSYHLLLGLCVCLSACMLASNMRSQDSSMFSHWLSVLWDCVTPVLPPSSCVSFLPLCFSCIVVNTGVSIFPHRAEGEERGRKGRGWARLKCPLQPSWCLQPSRDSKENRSSMDMPETQARAGRVSSGCSASQQIP